MNNLVNYFGFKIVRNESYKLDQVLGIKIIHN